MSPGGSWFRLPSFLLLEGALGLVLAACRVPTVVSIAISWLRECLEAEGWSWCAFSFGCFGGSDVPYAGWMKDALPALVVPLLGDQAGSREAGGDLRLDAALLSLQLVGGSLQRNFWGIAESRWAKLDGKHLWPGLVLLRKSPLMENRVLGLAQSRWRGRPQGLHV